MAYGVKYELFFSDVKKRKLKLEILERNYTGDPSPIIATDKPAIIEWDADDDIYSPIIGSRCKLSFFVTNAVEYDEFYKSDERQYKVKILFYNSYGNDLEEEPAIWNTMDVIWNGDIGEPVYYQPIWEGFLVVDRFQESVITSPYEINLEAIDGLGTLDGFDAPFNSEDTSDTENLFYYLKEILKLTGHEFDIYIANGIRKATSPPANDSIFHDIVINEYGLFNKNLTLKTAKQVLEQILKITNSRIFQSYARWYVVSNSNLIDNTIDTSGVIDTIAPSSDDVTDAPAQQVAGVVYSAPSITLNGQAQMYVGTSYRLNVLNAGSTPVSYEFTLPDGSTITQTGDSINTPVLALEDDGDVYSVEATDANGNTDTDSFTLSVANRPSLPVDPPTPPPPQETVDTNYTFKVDVADSVTGAYISPSLGTINYTAGEVGDAFSFQFNVVSLTGEFTSASQITSATITNKSGNYTVTKTLNAEFIEVTVSGNLPAGGAETLTLVGASDVQQFTTTFTRLGTVSNASVSSSALSVTGGEGKPYTMTITFTASSGYEWTGLGQITTVASADIGQTITTQITSATTLVVTITGAQGIADQSANITINGSPVFAQQATSVTIEPSSIFDFTSAGGYFDISVTSNGALTIQGSHSFFDISPTTMAAETKTVRVYVDANNTTSSRRGTIQFYPKGSLTSLNVLKFDQASNIESE